MKHKFEKAEIALVGSSMRKCAALPGMPRELRRNLRRLGYKFDVRETVIDLSRKEKSLLLNFLSQQGVLVQEALGELTNGLNQLKGPEYDQAISQKKYIEYIEVMLHRVLDEVIHEKSRNNSP